MITWTTERRKLSDLIPWPRNPRKINDAQGKRLAESFDEFGQVETIAIAPNGDILNGHQRLKVLAAKHGKDYTVDVRVASRALTEKEREKLTVYLHKGAAGEFDMDFLLAEFDMGELVEWGFEQGELDAFGGDKKEPVQDPGPQIDKADELRQKWGVETGQMWQLGEHRLICGDSTDGAVVERVMGGENWNVIVTDPPYGVDYEGGRNPESNTPRTKLAGDKSGVLYDSMLRVWDSYRVNKGVMYLWFADRGGKPVYDAICDAGYKIRAMIIWNKTDAHYGNFMAQYMQKHEPCLYCVKDGSEWYGPTNEVTVWDIKQPTVNENHPTEKPLECMARPIANSTKKGDIVCDPFAGSGTTIIACENLSRRCRAVEISPAYVAVAIERWHVATGKEPKLLT